MSDPFSQQAALYAKYRPTYPDQLYACIFEHLKQKKIAWDCGTGSGQVAGYLAGHFETIYATDISRQQMDHAVQEENITYINTPAEQTSFPSDCFDLITVAQAIHWFDFDRFYKEVNRTARDGALLAVFGYGMLKIEESESINPVIEQLYEFTFGKFFNENRRYVKKEYKTIPFPFEEISTPSFEITVQWTSDHLEGFFNSWSSVQKIKSEENFNPADDTLKAIRQEVSNNELLQITFPVFLRLGKIN